MADSVWDKAVQNILKTQAQSRYTRTPIEIRNFTKQVEALRRTFGGTTVEGGSDLDHTNVTGSFDPEANDISIVLHGNPTYKDLSNTIYHEDFHSLFNQSGNLAPRPVEYDTKGLLINKLISLIQNPENPAIRSWYDSNRAGQMFHEIPAYASAYSPGQLVGLDKGSRDRYISALSQALPDKASKLYLRMLKGYEASQQVQ